MLAACKDGTVTSTTLSKARVTPPPAMVKAVQQPRDRCAECAPPPTGVTLRRRRRAAHPRRVQLRDPALCLRLQGPVQPAGRRCSPDGHAGRRRPQPNLGERSMATLLTLLQKPTWLFRNATPAPVTRQGRRPGRLGTESAATPPPSWRYISEAYRRVDRFTSSSGPRATWRTCALGGTRQGTR